MLLYELFSDQDLNNVEATLQSLILLDPGSMADPLSCMSVFLFIES